GLLHALKKRTDGLLPRISLIARGLLGLDYLAFEILVRPPRLVCAETMNDFGEELIAITHQCSNVDNAASDAPETTAAGFVAQIRVFVGGADKDALTRLDHLQSAVARTIALSRAREKRLQ